MGKFVPTGFIFDDSDTGYGKESYAEIGYDSLLAETDEAVLIREEGYKEGWIPKSVILNGQSVDYENEDTLWVKEWFAEKEGWV